MEQDRPLWPEADKRQKTTQDEDAVEAAEAAKKNFPTCGILDLLRSLPANIVANHIYPFAVKVIKNREELITAVDEYLDEFYNNEDGHDDDEEEMTGDENEASFDEDEPSSDEDEPLFDEDVPLFDEDEDEYLSDEDEPLFDEEEPLSDEDEHLSDEDEPLSDEDEPLSDEDKVDSSEQNRIHYPIGDWDVSAVDDFTRPGTSTKICPCGTWRMGLVSPACLMVALHSSRIYPVGMWPMRRT
jgi:hypothetical protein